MRLSSLTQERIKEEQGKAAALQSRIDQILGARSLDNQDSTKIATAEGEIARLQVSGVALRAAEVPAAMLWKSCCGCLP
jgi:hypothetical protein